MTEQIPENGGTVYRALAEPLAYADGDGRTLEGYASVFNQRAHIVDHLGEYDEVIKQGAFKRSINARTPFLMFQHGRHPLIGQYPLGKIETLREDEKGLFVRARITDSWMTSPIVAAINERAVTGMSVAMESPKGKATWSNDGGVKLRTVNEAKLYELGPVLGEAYADTTVAMRSMMDGLEEVCPEYFAETNTSELREQITILTERIDALSEAPAPVERTAEETTDTNDTPDVPDLAEVTPDGPVDVEATTAPTFDQRQQRARLLRVERNNIGKETDDNDH